MCEVGLVFVFLKRQGLPCHPGHLLGTGVPLTSAFPQPELQECATTLSSRSIFFFKTVLSYSHATLNSQVPCPSIPFASALGVCLSAWLFLLVSGWSKAPSLGLKRQLCEECLLRFPRTHGWFLTPPCGSSSQNLAPSCGIYTQTHSTSAHTDTLT